jgi:UDP-2,3-diacylglucosamine pyrophosphatase LpxH
MESSIDPSTEIVKTESSSNLHTVVVSDLHLTNAEPPHPEHALWKKFKHREYFIDESFKRFLEYLCENCDGPIELILNGDIFDFDSVLKLPPRGTFRTTWLEKRRGLKAEEHKSRFKIGVIMEDHSVWMDALREFVLKGNKLVFIVGNHDMELHWPMVREDIWIHLNLPDTFRSDVKFCEWFYVSNQDTLIEHGNQYDAYCMCSDPIHPLIKKGRRIYVRLPFGNLAGIYMLNGMGLLNPHADNSFIKPFHEHVIFFYKYMLKVQPFILFTWFWGAFTTLIVSVGEGLLPALGDPLMVETRVEQIAKAAQVKPSVVRELRALHVHPAIYSPIRILKELWLDRAFLLMAIVIISFQFFSFMNLMFAVSMWWFLIPIFLVMPIFLFYAQSVQSEVFTVQKFMDDNVALAARIAGVKRVVHGHTHLEKHSHIQRVEVLNTGTWSAAFSDAECTKAYGRKCFAWLKPSESERVAELYEWQGTEPMRIFEEK